MIAEIGLPHCEIAYDQPRRKRGHTKNNFYALYNMAMLGVTNLSKVPLRFVTLLGFFSSVLSLLIGTIYLVYKLLFWANFTVGVAPLVIGLFFLGSVQLLVCGDSRRVHRLDPDPCTDVGPMMVELERINFEYPPGNPTDAVA